MKKLIKITFFVTLIFSTLSITLPALITPMAIGNLSVVVNTPEAPTDISLPNLKSVLKGERQRWKDGTKITLAFMKTSTTVGSDMSLRVFDMSEKQLNKYFLAQVFQGKMSSPEFFESETELINFVKNTKGAIAVVKSGSKSGLKTMTVNGKTSF